MNISLFISETRCYSLISVCVCVCGFIPTHWVSLSTESCKAIINIYKILRVNLNVHKLKQIICIADISNVLNLCRHKCYLKSQGLWSHLFKTDYVKIQYAQNVHFCIKIMILGSVYWLQKGLIF